MTLEKAVPTQMVRMASLYSILVHMIQELFSYVRPVDIQ